MENKVIVITGASAGIGAELAKQAAARGAKVVLGARRAKELEAVATAIGERALAVPCDVTKRADVDRLRDAAIARFGGIDVWVNNAGRGISRLPSELTDEDVDEIFRDNFKSALYGMQSVLPHFKARGVGQILNVSSGLARIPYAAIRSVYSAAKAALNSISASLRMELALSHPKIQVSVVMPGVVATDFGLSALGGGPDSRRLPGAATVESAAAAILAVIDHPRAEVYATLGGAEEVARYLADPAAMENEIAARFRR